MNSYELSQVFRLHSALNVKPLRKDYVPLCSTPILEGGYESGTIDPDYPDEILYGNSRQ